jgi:hypothetical protein
MDTVTFQHSTLRVKRRKTTASSLARSGWADRIGLVGPAQIFFFSLIFSYFFSVSFIIFDLELQIN